jgi:hypothetical protein
MPGFALSEARKTGLHATNADPVDVGHPSAPTHPRFSVPSVTFELYFG